MCRRLDATVGSDDEAGCHRRNRARPDPGRDPGHRRARVCAADDVERSGRVVPQRRHPGVPARPTQPILVRGHVAVGGRIGRSVWRCRWRPRAGRRDRADRSGAGRSRGRAGGRTDTDPAAGGEPDTPSDAAASAHADARSDTGSHPAADAPADTATTTADARPDTGSDAAADAITHAVPPDRRLPLIGARTLDQSSSAK
jgi:hypothetical protein